MDVADLVISIKPSNDSVSTGARIDYLIEVKNKGPSTARNIQVEDDIFGGKIVNMRLNDADHTYGDCKASCYMEELDAGKSIFITLSVEGGITFKNLAKKLYSNILFYFKIPNKYPINNLLINKAKVSSATYDPISTNNWCEALPVQIKEIYNLSVQINPSKIEARPGETFACDLSVTNNGHSKARGIKVKFRMTKEIEYVPPDEPKAEKYDNIEGIWSVDELAKDRPRSIRISARIKPDIEYAFELSAKVESPVINEPSLGNDFAKMSVNVLHPLSKICFLPIERPDCINSGDPIKYKIIVVNEGPSLAKEIKIETGLPEGTDPKSPLPIDWDSKIWTVSNLFPESGRNSRALEFELSTVGLAPGSCAKLYLSVIPDQKLQVEKIPPVKTKVKRIAHLNGRIEPHESKALPGDLINYDIYLKNDGPSTAKKINVNIKKPDEIEQVARSSTYTDNGYFIQGSCKWHLSELLMGDEKKLPIKANVKMINKKSFTISATATSDADDRMNPNVAFDSKTYILPLARLEVDPKSTPEEIVPGDPIKYKIVVKNNGPFMAKEIKIEIKLPKEIDEKDIKSIDWHATTGKVIDEKDIKSMGWDATTKIWNLGDIVAEEDRNSETLEFTVLTLKDKADYIAKMYVRLLTTSNSELQINCAVPEPVETKVKKAADLILGPADVDAPNDIYPLDCITYNLTVQNIGPSDCDITATAFIPDGTDFCSCDPKHESLKDNRVLWNLKEIAKGKSKKISLTVKIRCESKREIEFNAEFNSSVPNSKGNTTESIKPIKNIVNSAAYLIVELDGKDNGNETWCYEIKAKNKGPDMAKDVFIEIPIPANTIYVKDESDGWKYDRQANGWMIGELLKENAENENLKLFKLIVDYSKLPEGELVPNQATIRSKIHNLNKNNKASNKFVIGKRNIHDLGHPCE